MHITAIYLMIAILDFLPYHKAWIKKREPFAINSDLLYICYKLQNKGIGGNKRTKEASYKIGSFHLQNFCTQGHNILLLYFTIL